MCFSNQGQPFFGSLIFFLPWHWNRQTKWANNLYNFSFVFQRVSLQGESCSFIIIFTLLVVLQSTEHLVRLFVCIQVSFYTSWNASSYSPHKNWVESQRKKESFSLFKNRQHAVNAAGLVRGIYISHNWAVKQLNCSETTESSVTVSIIMVIYRVVRWRCQFVVQSVSWLS